MAAGCVGCVVGAVVLVGLAWWLLPVVAWGFGPEQIAIVERLFRSLLWIVPFSGVSTLWSAVLNASGAFTAVALAPIATPLMPGAEAL